jgi:hypothetical protein
MPITTFYVPTEDMFLDMHMYQGDTYSEDKCTDLFVHQTNCFTGNQVAGIAKTVFEKFPKLGRLAELKRMAAYPTKIVGGYDFDIQDRLMTANLYGQLYPGSPDATKDDDNFESRTTYLYNSLYNLLTERKDDFAPHVRIHMPLMASGIAASTSLMKLINTKNPSRYYFDVFVKPILEMAIRDARNKNCSDVSFSLVVYYLNNTVFILA